MWTPNCLDCDPEPCWIPLLKLSHICYYLHVLYGTTGCVSLNSICSWLHMPHQILHVPDCKWPTKSSKPTKSLTLCLNMFNSILYVLTACVYLNPIFTDYMSLAKSLPFVKTACVLVNLLCCYCVCLTKSATLLLHVYLWYGCVCLTKSATLWQPVSNLIIYVMAACVSLNPQF